MPVGLCTEVGWCVVGQLGRGSDDRAGGAFVDAGRLKGKNVLLARSRGGRIRERRR